MSDSIRTPHFDAIKLVWGLCIALWVGIPSSLAQVAAPSSQAVLQYAQRQEIFQPNVATGGMVASDHYLASEIGANILKLGGNAVDAAVATGFALAVVLPYAGNLGGGGFMLLHQSSQNVTEAIDFREMAPQQSSADMFLDHNGNVAREWSIESTAAIGVPGSVAGLLLALERHGTMSRETVIGPAIALAQDGFIVSPTLARLLRTHADHLYKSPPNRSIFFRRVAHSKCEPIVCPRESLRPLAAGETLIQADLANTLNRIVNLGADGFYRGPVASRIVDTINADRGQMTLGDLRDYKAKIRQPIWGDYRGIQIASMPPPSAGGIHLVQMLNMLEQWAIASDGWGSAINLHRFSEVAKLAYADRATHLGDADFYPVPIHELIAKDYAQSRLSLINETHATASEQIKSGQPKTQESTETTHFSVADRHGNLVATTTTLNLNFGSGWMAEGTGVLLNNEMDDFSAKPGFPNAFGLIGNQANAIAPGKRPLSSMTPTLLFKEGKPWIATGSPGGSRIITIVLQFITNVSDHGMNIASASAMPRMHHQWLPDTLWLEQGFSPDTIAILRGMGHPVKASRAAGRLQSVAIEGRQQFGASDPRSTDGAAIGILE
ncbi:gamma-glutamyltransferase [Orrella daihaiensis]|uniref:Glutathione hydrolase proenzyme n=1 Tax=Orrella daihaiensis TaxID=2782176 RepID=A0ABY4AMQ3_9BURK|nr:gamma-glutamyltransferase [Orrella daihaiensis]UOD49324.1 gamma-glutamyltransferase [Orrella daihaiensis]